MYNISKANRGSRQAWGVRFGAILEAIAPCSYHLMCEREVKKKNK